MIRLPPYIFFLGGFLTYASIFFSSAVVSMTMSVIGMTISLYIWYILAWNRDRHLKNMKLKGIVKPEHVIEHRIAGWCERALEFTNCKNVKANITKSLRNGDDLTEIVITWD